MTREPVLILGATSGIARHIALELAKQGYPICLAGRDMEETRRVAGDLAIRTGVQTWALPFEAEDTDAHASWLDQAVAHCGSFEGVVLAYGYLGEHDEALRKWPEAHRILHLNFVAAASILHAAALYLEGRGSGWIVGLSSVAGDRGRMSNYVYGSAKAGLTAFLGGLRARLQKSGVHVMTVKPGPVDTGMTFGRSTQLLVPPEPVAKAIVKALGRRRDVLYVPWIWWPIMTVLRAVPEAVFKRTRL